MVAEEGSVGLRLPTCSIPLSQEASSPSYPQGLKRKVIPRSYSSLIIFTDTFNSEKHELLVCKRVYSFWRCDVRENWAWLQSL